jgi:hypothetical protein
MVAQKRCPVIDEDFTRRRADQPRHDVRQKADPDVAAERHDRLGMKLHGPQRKAPVLDGHHDAVLALRGHLEILGQRALDREQRVVSARAELGRQPLEEPPAQHPDAGGLAVNGWIEHAERAAAVLDHALKAEAHAERRDAAVNQRGDRAGHVEIPRRAGTRREHRQVRLHVVERGLGKAAAQRHDLGAGLAQIVGERVDERILMIDEQHAAAGAGSRARRMRRTVEPARAADRVEERRGFQLGLGLFGGGIGIVEQGGAGTDLGDAVLHPNGPEREAGVEVAVEADHAHRTAVPRARRALVVLDELHRPRLGRSGDGDRPRVGQKRVERVELVAQAPFHVIDGVDQARVHLDLTPADHPTLRARRCATCRYGRHRCTSSARTRPWPR